MPASGANRRALIVRGDSRAMNEVADESVDLVVTSPPYWEIKDYGVPGQIGHGQDLHAYLRDLEQVWAECLRALRPAARLCVNVGDQFARASLYGRYRVIPLHAEIICQCSALGFDYMGSIIWRKKTTMNTSGGATIMGSYPYPPNGIVEIDFEYILLFRKPGVPRREEKLLKTAAAMTRDEWKSWFSGHWDLAGARKKDHEAPFPPEIPRRLIRMFSFPGDTVLDPFLGTGTTARVAMELGREAIGYEINPAFAAIAAAASGRDGLFDDVEVREAAAGASPAKPMAARSGSPAWEPRTPDLAPVQEQPAPKNQPPLHTVTSVEEDCTLVLGSGLRVALRDIRITDHGKALAYLRLRAAHKQVFLRGVLPGEGGTVLARVVLKNRICINAQLVKSGAAEEIARQEE